MSLQSGLVLWFHFQNYLLSLKWKLWNKSKTFNFIFLPVEFVCSKVKCWVLYFRCYSYRIFQDQSKQIFLHLSLVKFFLVFKNCDLSRQRNWVFFHKPLFSNLYIVIADITQCHKPSLFQAKNSIKSNNLTLKYK